MVPLRINIVPGSLIGGQGGCAKGHSSTGKLLSRRVAPPFRRIQIQLYVAGYARRVHRLTGTVN